MKADVFCQECREIKTSVQGDDFSVITGPRITINIYKKRTITDFLDIKSVVVSPVMYKCSLYDVLWLRW